MSFNWDCAEAGSYWRSLVIREWPWQVCYVHCFSPKEAKTSLITQREWTVEDKVRHLDICTQWVSFFSIMIPVIQVIQSEAPLEQTYSVFITQTFIA